jgi:hypothetical protein
MTFGTLEILATILIVFSVIKLVVILISPRAWLDFARKFYIKPEATSAVAFILAAIVLYFLVSSGVTIVQILATTLFIVLIITIGMAKYGQNIINWADNQDFKNILKDQWFYVLIWFFLLGWGIKAIFFSY